MKNYGPKQSYIWQVYFQNLYNQEIFLISESKHYRINLSKDINMQLVNIDSIKQNHQKKTGYM